MFWRMTGLSTASPVDTILDKDSYTLEELLDEDEIIQECKALNSRLIDFLRERTQVEQLIRYVVEEAPEDAERRHSFKFPFIACEIFTCEVDIILNTLVENQELMDLLFSFLKPEHCHNASLAGYFSKVVVCLLSRKKGPLMNYIQTHQEIFHQLVDLIGITSIMEVLTRLIGADDHAYSSYSDSVPWLDDIHVLEMIVDKFSSSDLPEVHANASETLCTITRFAPRGLVEKISSPSFIGRLFRHALEDSRPKSVLVHSLTVCISLLDPKRLVSASSYPFRNQLAFGSTIVANPETVEGMLESLGDLLKLLDNQPNNVLLTTYGRLEPPLGKHRLKIVEFISVLLSVGNETAEMELIRLGGLQQILGLFFKYPFNNFLHHHVENIVISCLESKRTLLVEHLLQDCEIVGKILVAEKNFTLPEDPENPTVPTQTKPSPRIGNIGHITRVANKLVQMGNSNDMVYTHLQSNADWIDWQTNVLAKRNAAENVNHWACGRPSTLQEDEDPRDRDYDVAALANNLSRAFRYGIYSNDDHEETNDPLERDDEDYFDDDPSEVVISSLRLGDDQESSLFTNSDVFGFEDNRVIDERSINLLPSPSPNSNDLADGDASLHLREPDVGLANAKLDTSTNGPVNDSQQTSTSEFEKPPEWVEWREISGECNQPNLHQTPVNHNGELENVEHTVVQEENLDIPISCPPVSYTGTTKKTASIATSLSESDDRIIEKEAPETRGASDRFSEESVPVNPFLGSGKLPEEINVDLAHPPDLGDSKISSTK